MESCEAGLDRSRVELGVTGESQDQSSNFENFRILILFWLRRTLKKKKLMMMVAFVDCFAC